MADPLPPTPFAEKLAAELRALHDRRERDALSASDEARYAELWAWWQSGGAGDDPEAQAQPDGSGDIPQEWVEAFGQREPAARAEASLPFATPATASAGSAAGEDLVREWEAWQSRRPAAGDPFSAMPGLDDAPPAPTEAEVLAARAEALGDAGAAPLGGADVEDLEPLFPDAEVPPESPAASATPAAAAPARDETPPPRRVVVHLVDGQVRRGTAAGLDLGSDRVTITTSSGAPESIARDAVRTVFFLRAPGEPAPEPTGQRVVVTFRDGRTLAGTSTDHEHISDAFTLVPGDQRTNAALVWIARHAVRDVVAG